MRKSMNAKKKKWFVRLIMVNRKSIGRNANLQKCKYCHFIGRAKIPNKMDGHSNFTCTNEKSLYHNEYLNANNTYGKFKKKERGNANNNN